MVFNFLQIYSPILYNFPATMASADDPFRSANLVYRAVESPEDDALFFAIQTEPQDFVNSNARLIRPQSRKDASEFQRAVTEDSLLGVVICLPKTADDAPNALPKGVGTIHVKPLSSSGFSPHKSGEIALDIVKEHQGKGYGTEAIQWALQWAFETAGLHRVGIRAFEWNYGARRLYERLGFKPEGQTRELLFYKGRFWDDFQFGMLEREWREKQGDQDRI